MIEASIETFDVSLFQVVRRSEDPDIQYLSMIHILTRIKSPDGARDLILGITGTTGRHCNVPIKKFGSKSRIEIKG